MSLMKNYLIGLDPPVEVNNLLQTLIIKNKCLKNNISFIDAGPKGILLGFKNNFLKIQTSY